MAKAPDKYTYRVKALVKIVDGDTFDCDIDLGFDVVLAKQRIRLMGIDTWESRTRNLKEKAKGLEAKAYTINKLETSNDGKFTLKSYGTGKYGRVLGEIFLKGEELSLNDLLKENGHAYEYHGEQKKGFDVT